ncbi:lysoplasmalogenase family protein [Riemerella anatipestifer]|uniref:lysoplasmalogenase family protein n=1 Tax=Riemerella anatipestifer TaxID=34085 RepID=UPI00285B119A|nr:lysoplasmalogenase family protein [Riemerella anatipestifer]MDR7776358.1 lysoplasmalogenase family protein [Riemerella anatipestifer]MDY3438722.1 lysoplasmalogenase family protein [Riemerella anatipestifer]MDY3455040.1 lysoplasmalogenase family protein [Riemerella anatipestifer]
MFFSFHNAQRVIYSKPLLIPIIALIYYQLNKTKSLSNNKLFLTGLFFSFLGDVFLLKDSGFLYGLASFLLAQLVVHFK